MVEGTGDSQLPGAKPLPPGAPVESRRSFLGVLLGLGAFFVGALLSVPLIRFALFPLLRRTTELKNSTVGDLSAFSSLSEPVMRTIQIEQVDGWRKAVSEKAVYVTKDGRGQLLVLTSICPHLGCPINWSPDRAQFVCPCHRGAFDADGRLVSGPPPRGMDALEWEVRAGRLFVRWQDFKIGVAQRSPVEV